MKNRDRQYKAIIPFCNENDALSSLSNAELLYLGRPLYPVSIA